MNMTMEGDYEDGEGEEDYEEAEGAEGALDLEAIAGDVGAEREKKLGEAKEQQQRKLSLQAKPRPWDPLDPIFSSNDLARFMERAVKYNGTSELLALLFGNASLAIGDIAAAARTRGVRRMLQVYPSDSVLAKLPAHQRYLHTRISTADVRKAVEDGAIPVNPFLTKASGEDAEETEEKTPRLHGKLRNGETIVRREQRWWVFSLTHEEDYQRNRRTGILRMPRRPIELKWQNRLAGYREQGRFAPDVTLTPEEQLTLDFTLSQVRREQSEIFSLHRRAFLLHVSKQDSVQFDSQDLWDFWERVLATAGRIPQNRDELLPPGKNLRGYTFQTVEESIDAAQALYDYFSTVLQEPLIEEYSEEEAERIRYYCGVLRGDIEQVVFACANEWNDVRKIIEMRKVRLGWERKLALGMVDKGDPFGIGDDWPFGPMRDVRVGDLVFAPTDPTDPNYIPPTYLGPLAEMLPANYRPGDSRPTFNLGDGNRLMAIHALHAEPVSKALNAIEFDLLGKVESSEPIYYDDIKKLPLIDWAPEDIYFTYWETDSRGDSTIPHTPAEWVAAGRPEEWQPHGVPRFDWALWANWPYVMKHLHLIAYLRARKLEEQAERLGLNNAVEGEMFTIPTRYDGSPETNFFNLEKVAWQVWRLQPLETIKKRLDEVVMPLFEGGQFDRLRGEIVKFFGPLPHTRFGRTEITDLMEEYLWWADRLALSHVIWLTADGRNRRANDGDVKGLLSGGWGIYPTERMATRHPDIQFGRPDYPGRAGDTYSPFTFEGQQRSRSMLLFIPYDANLIIDVIKGIVEQIEFGIQPTVDDIYNQLMSLLGVRKMYIRRLMNVLNFLEASFKGRLMPTGKAWEGVQFGKEVELLGGITVARTAFRKIREALGRFFVDGEWSQEAWQETSSAKVDKFGLEVLRHMTGELHGDDESWVNAVDGVGYIEKVRATLPGAA